MCCFFVSLLSLFFPCSLPLPSLPSPPAPEQHSVPHRQEGEPGSFQFGRAHDHVSFSCAIPTHPISKTTSQFHQPYSYSLPPLQRSARCPVRPRGAGAAESGRSALRVPLSGLSGPLCDPRDPAWPGAPAAARSAWWVKAQCTTVCHHHLRAVWPLHEATAAFLASFVTGGEKSCWGSWGMHGVIGSTLDPVNLIVHKPLDTPDIGLLFCVSYLTACLLCKVGEMFYLCCHVQIYKLNEKHA